MAAPDPNKNARLIESPGSTKDYYLFRVDGREMLSSPFEFRLTLRASGDIPPASVWIGSSITFIIGAATTKPRKINGKCVRFEHAYQRGRYVEFVLDIAPTLSDLRLKRDSRIFTDKSAKQVIAKVLREHSIVFDDSKVKAADSSREYCIQYNESDFDFVNRLMEREGIFYYFRYDENAGRFKHKMYLADDTAGFFDGEPFELSFRRDYGLRGVQSLETSYAAATGAWKTNDYDFKKPSALKTLQTGTRLDYAHKTASVYDWPAGSPKPDDVKRRSKLAMEEAEAASLILEGVGNYIGFAPGGRHQIDDPRLSPKERKLVIRSVTHALWDPAGLEEGEPTYQQHFSAAPSQQPYRPPPVTAPHTVRGPQTGVVIDDHDPEGFGRVKVKFHWDYDSASSAWLRVAQQWAGGRMGAQFIPRVDMEVLIDFLEGDPDRPIVVGCIYNGQNKPPFELPGHLSQSGWHSESYGGGDVKNIFMFEDKSGGEEIYTFAGRNLRRETVNDEQVDISGESTFRVAKNHRETIDQDHETMVGGTDSTTTLGDFTVKATGMIDLFAVQGIKIATTGTLTIIASSVSIAVGGSTIAVTPAGVAITGPVVKIN